MSPARLFQPDVPHRQLEGQFSSYWKTLTKFSYQTVSVYNQAIFSIHLLILHSLSLLKPKQACTGFYDRRLVGSIGTHFPSCIPENSRKSVECVVEPNESMLL